MRSFQSWYGAAESCDFDGFEPGISRVVADRSVRERRQNGERERRTCSEQSSAPARGLHFFMFAPVHSPGALLHPPFPVFCLAGGGEFFRDEAGRQAVQAVRVFHGAGILEPVLPFCSCPAVQRLPLADVLEQRYAIAARGLHDDPCRYVQSAARRAVLRLSKWGTPNRAAIGTCCLRGKTGCLGRKDAGWDGGSSSAQNITVMRPSTRRWAAVSLPLPVRSRYATVRSSRTRSAPVGRGEMLTRLVAGCRRGEKIRCRAMKSRCAAVMLVNCLPIPQAYARREVLFGRRRGGAMQVAGTPQIPACN